ncbi:hypothetical protein EZV62_018372 [Acer yangbiense]|uniref:Retroviral polymerase SH3-like domain-containing protein n=1 Tax=Acer yangbiense TaxID=1000413 RepID=A0A5C7HJU2_9ROSI|nr:hypothetical protein EZV62_018372 [Acer yangbiense]
MLKQLGGRCHLLHVFSNSNTTSLCTTITVTHVKFAIDDKSLKKLSSSHRRVWGTRCGARRRVRYDSDDDEDGEEDQYYGHNEEIAMLELYTQSARGEALLVTALLDDNEVEVLIFKVPEARRTKLEDKGEKCILVGYGDRTMGYRLYNPVTKKVIFSRDVIFEENESWNWDQTKASRSAELMPEEETREMATEPQIPRDQQTPQRGSSSPQRYDASLPIERDFSDMMPRGTRSLEDLYENTEQVEEDVTLYCLLMTSDPVSFEEANQEEK